MLCPTQAMLRLQSATRQEMVPGACFCAAAMATRRMRVDCEIRSPAQRQPYKASCYEREGV